MGNLQLYKMFLDDMYPEKYKNFNFPQPVGSVEDGTNTFMDTFYLDHVTGILQ